MNEPAAGLNAQMLFEGLKGFPECSARIHETPERTKGGQLGSLPDEDPKVCTVCPFGAKQQKSFHGERRYLVLWAIKEPRIKIRSLDDLSWLCS
jgi:hypothetical protein